jgi:hypothetical protein
LRVVVTDHNVIWIAAMTVIEVIEMIELATVITPHVATLLVVVLQLEIVLPVLETLLLHAGTKEMEDEEEAIVGPLDVVPHQEEEAIETEVVVQNPAIGEEIVSATKGMTEMIETTCETFETMAMTSVLIRQTTILTIQTSTTIKTSSRIKIIIEFDRIKLARVSSLSLYFLFSFIFIFIFILFFICTEVREYVCMIFFFKSFL